MKYRFGTIVLALFICCLTIQNVRAFENSHLLDDALKKNDPEAQYTLAHLYLKGKGGVEFDVEEGIDRRSRLASEALACGAVRLADLRSLRE